MSKHILFHIKQNNQYIIELKTEITKKCSKLNSLLVTAINNAGLKIKFKYQVMNNDKIKYILWQR